MADYGASSTEKEKSESALGACDRACAGSAKDTTCALYLEIPVILSDAARWRKYASTGTHLSTLKLDSA